MVIYDIGSSRHAIRCCLRVVSEAYYSYNGDCKLPSKAGAVRDVEQPSDVVTLLSPTGVSITVVEGAWPADRLSTGTQRNYKWQPTSTANTMYK